MPPSRNAPSQVPHSIRSTHPLELIPSSNLISRYLSVRAAIPVAIFSAHADIRQKYLRKWLKDPSLDCEDFRDVVDWSYYRERLARTIQKIITIPAGMQRISNPCPRVEHPVWLQRQLDEKVGILVLSDMDLITTSNLT